jgi:anti-sigma B factor antagonist
MTTDGLRFEIREGHDDGQGNKVTTLHCHGRVVSNTIGELKDAVKPLIGQGGRIVVDLGDVNYLDSSGLGGLVTLKVSALKQGYCILEFANMTPRVLELLRISNLSQMLSP